MHIHTHIHIYTYIYTYMYIYIHTHIHPYIYIYTHTYIYIYIDSNYIHMLLHTIYRRALRVCEQGVRFYITGERSKQTEQTKRNISKQKKQHLQTTNTKQT